MRFMIDKVVLGQVFLPALRFSPFSTIPPVLPTHLHVALTRTGEALDTQKMLFRVSGRLDIKVLSLFSGFSRLIKTRDNFTLSFRVF